MSNIDIRALREAAEKATKGQWVVEFDDEIYSTDGVNNEQIAMVFSENEARDAAFIAAANPATVLALLDELEAAEAQIDESDCEKHEALRLAEERAETINAIYDRERREFSDCVAEKTRLALELVNAERRIAELEAREVKLPELKMLRDYLAEVTHREREDILVGVRLEFFRALEEAGVKVAAACKGEAS
ncbi:ead/Ea22-like family protein [Enterobacter roggenkampii]|uniref:ead/Ea22-like family protein n=1 Tax=Enterobacter roggenkampii TaxID=1812935 RepID=UPI0020033585|nr:ead/Ea22-like family protein [Enterobacter roggenkampii]MCK7041353.1 ead/Ea22-like family protein [Enterobacter roggenkampii]